jgi:hypothetical protein
VLRDTLPLWYLNSTGTLELSRRLFFGHSEAHSIFANGGLLSYRNEHGPIFDAMRLPTRGVIALRLREIPGAQKRTTFASKQEGHPTFRFGQIAPERLFAMPAIDSTTLEGGGRCR